MDVVRVGVDRGRRRLPTAVAVAIIGLLGVLDLPFGHPSRPPALVSRAPSRSLGRAEIRINQVGFRPSDPKTALVMLAHPEPRLSFVVERGSTVVLRGSSSRDLGGWSRNYPAVYELDFTRLRAVGRFRVGVLEPPAWSPDFRVASAPGLYRRLVLNAVRYFTSERDGGSVDGAVLNRKPANLADRRAYVYAPPRYGAGDNLLEPPRRIGGPVDVSGGWFDAGGGYEKFAYTGAYADGLMLMAARDYGGAYRSLLPEALFGLSWLAELWSPQKKVLYVQVGIGNGTADGTIAGDYDYWFLPQREDHLGGQVGDAGYYVEHRPVFEAAPPGEPVSPALAGRFAADFALGAEVEAHRDRRLALHDLSLARSVYASAAKRTLGPIVTTFPHDYYPGSEWESGMLWGGAEIALADEALDAGRRLLASDLSRAGRWARAYIEQGHPRGGDTLNLYDNGAIGEAELLRAMRQTPLPPPVPRRTLLGDLAAQLRLGETWAAGDPFELGAQLGPSDATPHALGLYVTDALFLKYGGRPSFVRFAHQQLDFVFGANPWGSSFVVGAGTIFPHCLHSEIANLAGSLTGDGDLQLGATVDGPSSAANFVGLGRVSGMRACSAGDYSPFDTAAVKYEDNVVAWPSSEPADDYGAMSLYALTLAAAGAG